MTQTIRKPLVFLLSLLLCFTLAFTAVPATALADAGDTGTTPEGWSWLELADGTLEITAFSDPTSDITIPQSMDSKRVTALAADAFKDKTGLTSITLPKYLASVGDNAFNGCTALTKVTIYCTSTTFGADVFSGAAMTDGIYGYDGSTAQTYATAQGFTFHTLYTVTFDSQGGSAVASKTAENDTTITTPAAPTRTGYTFQNWYKENTYDHLWDFATDTVSADTTLFAKWTIDNYTVTFDSQGGSTVASKTADYDTTITAPTDPTRTGYAFAFWFKESTYDHQWDFINDTVLANTTLYAKWAPIPCNLAYDYQDGATIINTKVHYDDSITRPADPTWTGHTFVDWYTSSAYTTQATFPYHVMGNATLYAKWTTNGYAVIFHSPGGSAVAGIIVDYDSLIPPQADPVKAGYTFRGWFKDSDCTNPWNFATDKVTDTTDLYAKWTTNGYAVTFDSQLGSAVPGITVNYDSLIPQPNEPTRTGYTFRGWFKESVCTNPWNFTTDKVVGAITLYAKWQLVSADLKNIQVSVSSLSPAFVSTKYAYTLKLDEYTKDVTITPAKVNDTASMAITIDGKSASDITLSVLNGQTVKVKIVLTMGKLKKTYNITVSRPKSTNNYLDTLTSTGAPLSPTFDKNILSYSVELPEGVDSTIIMTQAEHPLAKASFVSANVILKNDERKVVTIKVKNQAGKTRTYTVNVHRAASTQVDVTYIQFKPDYGMKPFPFDPAISDYDVVIPSNISSITVSTQVVGYKASVTMNGSKKTSYKVSLGYGQQKTVTIVAKSQTGIVEKRYNIKITRMNTSGLFLAGKDIAPGEYFIMATTSAGCAVELLDGSKNVICGDGFYTFGIFNVQSGQYMYVSKDAKGKSMGMFCPLANAPSIGMVNGHYVEGMYKVGTTLPAGTYRLVPYNGMEGIADYIITNNSLHLSDAYIDLYSSKTITLTNGQYLEVFGGYIVPVS